MSLKKFFLFLFVLLALGGYYYFFEHGKGKPESTPDSVSSIFYLSEEDEVIGLYVKAGDEETELIKQENQWSIDKPVKYPADQFVTNGIVDAIRLAKASKRVKVSEADLEEFGLKDSRVVVGVRTKENDDWRYLALGDIVPIGSACYAKWQDEEYAFMIDERFRRAFNRTTYSFRRKQLFDLSKEDVNKIDVSLFNNSFSLARKDNIWYVNGEEANVLDYEKVKAYISEIRSIYAKEFLDEEDWRDEEFGIKPEDYYIRLGVEGEGDSVLVVGKTDINKGGIYAFSKDEGALVLVNQKVVRQLDRGLDHFSKTE